MIWEDPLYLWLLVLIPLVAIAQSLYQRYQRRQRQQFMHDPIFEQLYQGEWKFGRKTKDVLMLLGLSLLIVALSGPKIGTEVREIKRQGIDLMVALDLSASMNARDISPSRLSKARYETLRLVENLKGDRIGLIVFTGEAFLQSPLTVDYSALRLFLNIVETDQMPSSTTNFDAAFSEAIKAFESKEQEEESEAAKVLLVISDGENFGPDFDQSLEALTDLGVKVYTIGIGTGQGTTIPLVDPNTGSIQGYKTDNTGQTVVTRLESEVLQEIAETGGGRYYEVQRGNENFDAFLNQIGELQKGELAAQEYADYKNQYQWVTLLALICFGLSILLPANKKPTKKTP
jgi:Ca-activated chloride channel family protein